VPIYEFACDSCKEVTEFTMKFSDPLPEKCTKCDNGNLKKLISRTNFQLKGGGWYNEGYSVPAKKPAKPESATAPAETKTEPAPAKTETPKATPAPAKPSGGDKT
jgi:putative FmdB family regulatory protein